MLKKILVVVLSILIIPSSIAAPIRIVAAENFYGEVAKKIGGSYVEVFNVLSNPNQDPHLFSSNPSTAREIAHADLILYNGLGYDSWMAKLISATDEKNKKVIVVGDLLGRKDGDNPHIWYEPNTMLVYAQQLAKLFSQMDKTHADYYQAQLTEFTNNYQPLLNQINVIRQQYQGTQVIATEPVFTYMTNALGLIMNGNDFQLNVMNETEPSVANTRDFENKLKNHQVKILIYNNQVENPLTEYMKNLAKEQHINIVGVSETQPVGKDYTRWMMDQLDALESALKQSK